METILVLANVDPLTRAESYLTLPRLYLRDVFLVVGAAVLLCGLLALVVARSRRRRKKIRGGEKVFRPSGTVESDGDEGAEQRRRYKRRVRRRHHRQTNPTLAETGGLPQATSRPAADPTGRDAAQ